VQNRPAHHIAAVVTPRGFDSSRDALVARRPTYRKQFKALAQAQKRTNRVVLGASLDHQAVQPTGNHLRVQSNSFRERILGKSQVTHAVKDVFRVQQPQGFAQRLGDLVVCAAGEQFLAAPLALVDDQMWDLETATVCVVFRLELVYDFRRIHRILVAFQAGSRIRLNFALGRHGATRLWITGQVCRKGLPEYNRFAVFV
jgi:hypothetical protein